MANHQSHFPGFLLLLLLSLSLTVCSSHNTFASSSSDHYHGHNFNETVRSLSFSLYQHETINKTGFIVVDGVAGAGVTQTTTPFGTVFVFRDNLTASADPSASASSVKGVAEGVSITSSFDGLRSLSLAKITLKIDGYEGSISILGGTHNTKPSDDPVVGGTGDFLFVQGYIRSSPVDLKGLTVVYRIDFFLYWPPYAAAAVRALHY